MSRSVFWWALEVGLPFLGVMAGVALLIVAALATVMHAPDATRLFLAGLCLWAGGLAWGAFVNDGIPLRRWLIRP